MGVGPGDRVAVIAHNHPRTLALLFACARLGAMLAPLNWRLAPPELQWIVDDAAPAVLFTDESAPALHHPGMTRRPIEAPPEPGPAPQPHTRDDVLLVYTSGATGRPKGVVLTRAAIAANAAFSRHLHGLTEADHVLTVLPLFHVGGLNIQTIPALLTGAAVSLHPRFDPAATIGALAHDRPTLTVLVPATLQAMLRHPAWSAADLSSLRAITTGSTVVQPAVIAPFIARGVPVLQVYGSTETAPIALYTPIGAVYPPTSTGHPGPGAHVRAVDDEGHPVPPAAAGEIQFQGPQMFDRYWRNPQATQDAFTEGWYRTGDIGTQSPDGAWTVHDRKKNVIISGGENIYPAEIERVLHEMPGIAEAAVIGVPDPRWQETPEAHVVLAPGAAWTEAAVIAHLHTQLARFKAPRRVHFVPSLPRNAMGKVQHHLLAAP
jgi:fatty-acyl-CoA synthase